MIGQNGKRMRKQSLIELSSVTISLLVPSKVRVILSRGAGETRLPEGSGSFETASRRGLRPRRDRNKILPSGDVYVHVGVLYKQLSRLEEKSTNSVYFNGIVA